MVASNEYLFETERTFAGDVGRNIQHTSGWLSSDATNA
jgi:hypothetical protein